MPVFVLIFLSLLLSCQPTHSQSSLTQTVEGVELKAELTYDSLDVPWGLAFLPDGSLLVGERSGTLYHIKNDEREVVKGLPEIFVNGQGGLMDIVLHPNYDKNKWIYIAYAQSDDGKFGNTAVMRAKLENGALVQQEQLFKATPDSKTGRHFGGRILFDKNGYLFITVGERGNRDDNPQTLENHSGKVHRIYDDGRIPEDNPFYDEKGAVKSIYSYGHRNPQGMDLHPKTKKVWTHEHGPKGGDEINIIAPGNNYGWPVITYGINYWGTKITDETHKEGMEQPLHYWDPSIAPSGMAFIRNKRYGALQNDLLLGSLKFQYLHLCILDDEKVVKEVELFKDIGRVRTVISAPDGFIYFSVEGKGIYKLTVE